MGDHAKRGHSILSASGAHRWLACPPSALLETQFPDTTSESAAEGTLAHEVAEAKVRNYFLIDDFNKRKLNAFIKKEKENPLWDDEILRHTDTSLDYVKAAAMKFEHDPSKDIEKRVYFGKYTHAEMRNPADEEEGYGIADCILIGGRVIHVIDFKYGQSPNGRVSAVGNPQMMLYALGAYEACKLLYPIDTIRMSIVQPRLPDGISEWEIPLSQLLTHSKHIEEQAVKAWKGEGGFAPDEKTCMFCRARGQCRARAEKNIQLAFSPDAGKLPPLISNEEMGKYLLQGIDLVKWYEDMKDSALAECLKGNEVPGWKAVEGRGSRVWTDMDKAFSALKEKGIDETVLWEKNPLSLAQVEKVVGKKEFEEYAGGYVKKAPGKPALARESDKRPAITNKVSAKDAFKEENINE